MINSDYNMQNLCISDQLSQEKSDLCFSSEGDVSADKIVVGQNHSQSVINILDGVHFDSVP